LSYLSAFTWEEPASGVAFWWFYHRRRHRGLDSSNRVKWERKGDLAVSPSEGEHLDGQAGGWTLRRLIRYLGNAEVILWELEPMRPRLVIEAGDGQPSVCDLQPDQVASLGRNHKNTI